MYVGWHRRMDGSGRAMGLASRHRDRLTRDRRGGAMTRKSAMGTVTLAIAIGAFSVAAGLGAEQAPAPAAGAAPAAGRGGGGGGGRGGGIQSVITASDTDKDGCVSRAE